MIASEDSCDVLHIRGSNGGATRRSSEVGRHMVR